MNQLLQRLHNESFTLMVSLPRNDVQLARAALHGGAQGLKVHLNVEHFASGTRFGSYDEEHQNIAAICDIAGEFEAPVGVVPGASGAFATLEEFELLAQLGVDFFDAYPFDAPAWSLTQTHLDVMLAAYHGGPPEELLALSNLGMTMCEASFLSHDDYGKSLTALDCARYHALAEALDLGDCPIIVPSQKKIVPSDLPVLREAGVRGLLIGAVVTGREAETIQSATREFAAALEEAPEHAPDLEG